MFLAKEPNTTQQLERDAYGYHNKATVSDFTLQKEVKSIGKEDLKKSELVKSSSHEGSNIVSGKKRYVEEETRVVPVESSKKSN